MKRPLKKYINILSHPYSIFFLSGLFLNLSFFIQNIFFELLALFTIAPAFYALTKVKGIKRYVGGLLFFGVWFIPTVYWWFLIFEWWDALLKLTFFTLLALAFYLPTFLKKKTVLVDFILVILLWTLLSTARLILPFSQSWWMAHIGYTQWLNPLLLQVIKVAGVTGLIFSVLTINATSAYLFIKKKYVVLTMLVLAVFGICLVGNLYLHQESDQDEQLIVIAVQSAPSGGVRANANKEDIVNLKELSIDSLEGMETGEPIAVLWPENMIEENNSNELSQFADENDIYLIYNQSKQNGDNYPYNTVVIVGPEGQTLLTNYKKHKAPGEQISELDKFSATKIEDLLITADICYDLHFSDIRERINGEDILFAPVDDDRFGNYMPILHAADTTFRAIENNVNIVTASTNGPTMFVNNSGVVIDILEVGTEAVLVIEFKR